MVSISLRTCVGCRQKRPKNEMLRIGRSRKGEVFLTSWKGKGRGAYLCPNLSCLNSAKGKRLEHALRAKVPDSIYEEIEKLLSKEQKSWRAR